MKDDNEPQPEGGAEPASEPAATPQPGPAATPTPASEPEAAPASQAVPAAAPAPAPAPIGSDLAVMPRLWALRLGVRVPARPTPLIVGLCALWLLMWIGMDRLETAPDPTFSVNDVPLLAWYGLALVGFAELLRRCCAPAPAFGAALALVAGLVPVPLLLAAVAAPILNDTWLLGTAILAIVYSLLYLARGLRSFTGESQPIAAVAGIAFLVGFIWLTDALDVVPELWTPREEAAAAAAGDVNADAETLMFEQSARIDGALAGIPPQASPDPRAFFLGFAGVGDEKEFAQEIGLASRVLGERYAIGNRQLLLLNDERDLDRAPLASVSGLRYALRGLAARMNVERDVLFLAISSHGAQDPAIVVSNAQLPLDDLTDEALAAALSESGIKWRVIIISACYAGGFIDALKDRNTIIIAAAAADRTSFGCSTDRDLTYFGEAFYRDALPEARSLRAAFEAAKAAIAVRERREHVDASKPQAYFGADLEAKLASMGEPP